MSHEKNSAREWLLANDYEDIAARIDKVMLGWERKGTSARRNWWLVLAGNSDGSEKTIEGIRFPSSDRHKSAWAAQLRREVFAVTKPKYRLQR